MVRYIFAREKWYIERPEPEEQIKGILKPVTLPSGPASRTALLFVLHTESEELPVYAAGVEQLLESFTESPIIIQGKRIDFSPNGFAIELWIGKLEIIPAAT